MGLDPPLGSLHEQFRLRILVGKEGVERELL